MFRNFSYRPKYVKIFQKRFLLLTLIFIISPQSQAIVLGATGDIIFHGALIRQAGGSQLPSPPKTRIKRLKL